MMNDDSRSQSLNDDVSLDNYYLLYNKFSYFSSLGMVCVSSYGITLQTVNSNVIPVRDQFQNKE